MKAVKFIKRLINFLRSRYAPRGARISFSGEGEDIIVGNIFDKLKIKNIFYIDIGAHHPVYGNNTYGFYLKKSSGILIEPNIELYKVICKKRSGDVCLNVGIGKNDGESNFFSFKRNTRNTFSETEALAWEKSSGDKANVIKLPIISLNTIIEKYCLGKVPDLISIDTEGYEYEILSGFDWKVKPKVFCLEVISSSGDVRDNKLHKLMIDNGYFIHSNTSINSIYVLKDIFY